MHDEFVVWFPPDPRRFQVFICYPLIFTILHSIGLCRLILFCSWLFSLLFTASHTALVLPRNRLNFKNKRTTKPWSSNTIWHTKTLEQLWHFLFDSLCFTFSKINSFNSGVSRLGGSIHPHGNPRYSWKKIRILFSLFEAWYKTSFSGSMFVCLPWAITNWIWEMFSFKNTGNPIAFTETKAWPWHW